MLSVRPDTGHSLPTPPTHDPNLVKPGLQPFGELESPFNRSIWQRQGHQQKNLVSGQARIGQVHSGGDRALLILSGMCVFGCSLR